ncbi:DEAD/DEAH box helicase [Candidatus Woesearchaeota archaeon]|nr:DEAD/DEAH box helicase [Candidatus Woesearchaeota archaeon]
MIKDFQPRLYQQTIFATSIKYNTLVVLPTGMGKTNIFLMLAAQRLKQYPKSKVLFIGPTRPLIEQYRQVFEKHFEISGDKMAVFTGHVQPKKRAELWKKAQIIFSTPQGLENDIISNRIKLEEVSLLGVDEAHRAVGDYAYVFVAKQYVKKAAHPRILGLTASPGSDMDKIGEVIKNLHIEEIEVRTDEDPDVKQYIQEIEIEWVKVELPPIFMEVKKYLDDFISSRLSKLKKWGILHRASLKFVNKKDLLGLQAQLRGRAAQGEKDFVLWNSISLLAEIMKVQHALELLETQGVISLHTYLNKLEREGYTSKVKAVKNLVKDLNFRSALIKTEALFEQKAEHPKLIELQRLVEKEFNKNKDTKIIVFNQYRDNAADIAEKLNNLSGIKARLFIGQMKKGETGLSQKNQKEMLDQFRASEFNVLVATSVGEEGLDIPRVDLVIFYEPVPSAIRHIQRKGRTGRQEKGRVIILMAEGTRDVGYKWSAHHKQKRMYSNLKGLKKRLSSLLGTKKDATLNKFIPDQEKVKIYADYREKGSGVIKQLVELDALLELEQLEFADYILSSRAGVEFKTVEDFVQSILDGRIMDQIRELKRNFERPIVIIEGINDIYSVRNIHPNAIRGMIANIIVSYGIPLVYTKSTVETASLLYIIAKREQEEFTRNFMPHSMKRVQDTKWLQEYIVSSFPGIGATLAKPLLRHFGSIKKIVNASVDELKEVELIGKKKAEKIRRVLDGEWES